MLAFLQSIVWLRHPILLGGAFLYGIVKLADFLLGDKTVEQIRQGPKSTSQVEEQPSQLEARVCDGDIVEDCAPEEDEAEIINQNNNSKNVFTDVATDASTEEEVFNSEDTESVQTVQTEPINHDILRKSSRDAEAQTKSRESRDSFRCRGCGVERNRKRFEEEMEGREFDRDHISQRSLSDTFKKKKAATIDSPQLVSVHHYIGKLVQVSASNGVMVGDNNCMHIQNAHSETCLSPEEGNSVCYQCQRQRMTDDQKSEMATQADCVQTDGGEYYEEDGDQSDGEDFILSQSEEEMLITGESPPDSPLSPPPSKANIFDANDGESSCEVTISQLEDGEESCDLCPNCVQNSPHRRMTPPPLSPDGDMKQLFVEAKLKIYQATKELREHQGRSRRSRQNDSFQRSTPNNSGSSSPPVKSKMNVRESVRKILARRRQSRDRQSRERQPSNSISDPNHTFYV